jgi:long-chain acyl-CoA synthetase
VNLVTYLLPEDRVDGIALVAADGATVTAHELRHRVAAGSAGLAAAGVQPGDRVAFAAPSEPESVVRYLAILAAGAVGVPLNPQAPAAEIERLAGQVGPWLGPDAFPAAVPGAPFTLVARADSDPAVLLSTSGTSGAARAATLTHGNLRANLEQVAADPTLRLGPDDRTLCALPLFHIFGANSALGLPLAAGAPITLVEPQAIMDAAAVVARDQIRIIATVPTVYAAWLGSSLPNDTFASVRLAVSGAAAMPVRVAQVFETQFGVRIREGYGLTEAAPIVSVAASDDRFGVVGRPLAGVEVRLVDPADPSATTLPGDPGEVLVRGAQVFAGYWNDSAATAEVLDDDGWLHTGDIAVLTKAGALQLVDRSKDLIIVSGFNVYPAEVEAVLALDPAVAAVGVTGEPDSATGEAVVAYVVGIEGARVDVDALRDRCRDELARYKCPKRIEVVEELPRTATGKVLRRRLRS